MSGFAFSKPVSAIFHQTCCEEGRASAYFAAESAKADAFGARHVARVLEACVLGVALTPRIDRQIRNWPDDLAASGLAFRLNAGLHALVRKGRAPALRLLADRAEGPTPGAALHYEIAVAEALTAHEDELLVWLSRPTQTNEVGRMAGLMAVLAELDAQRPLQTELLELGASAGLNLNLPHYAFALGRRNLGNQKSDVRIAPFWRGKPVPDAQMSVVAAQGVDLTPLNVGLAEDRERLYAYIWPGMADRIDRLRGAIAIAGVYPPKVERGRAGPWLMAQLAKPQPVNTRRIVFHSMVMQYVPLPEREAIARTLNAAGSLATPDRPLARVALEWLEDRSEVQVRLKLWDGTSPAPRDRLVATCHPYAEWFNWRGLA